MAGAEVGSEVFSVDSVNVTKLARGGLRVSMRLAAPARLPGVSVTRIAEAYPGVAGFRTQTVIESAVPLALSKATLDEAVTGAGAAPTIHAFRAGADWREPDYEGPPFTVGDPHAGTWRESRSAGAGQALAGNGEWITLADGGRSAFMVMERNDLPSSRVAFDGTAGSAVVDFSRDVLSLGPFEESAHIENPFDGQARVRTVRPGEPFALPAVFTGFGLNAADEPWQFHRYLVEHRMLPVRARRHVQLQRRRLEPHLHGREGRHGLRHGAGDRADRAADGRRDVHPRRRVAGALGRLAAGLAAVSRAALGRLRGLEVQAAVPGLRVLARCATRSRR